LSYYLLGCAPMFGFLSQIFTSSNGFGAFFTNIFMACGEGVVPMKIAPRFFYFTLVTYSCLFFPVCHVSTRVLFLFFLRYPSTVFRAIITIIIYSIKLKFSLEPIFFSPLDESVSIIAPFLTNGNTSTTIMFVMTLVRIITSLNHAIVSTN